MSAIGDWSNYTIEVTAPDKDAAGLKIYETHEHLSNVKIVCVSRCDAPGCDWPKSDYNCPDGVHS